MTSERPVALVTGASRGIGRQAALVLARAGYDVAFTARTGVEGQGTVPPRTRQAGDPLLSVPGSLAATEREVAACGVRALGVLMDLADEDSVLAAADTVLDAWGHVDVLVNNAVAHCPHDRFAELGLATILESLTANVVHQVAMVQAVLPAMVARGHGTVVNVCSGSATIDPPAPPGEGGWGFAYAAAKAAFGRIAGAVNAEYVDRGVRAFNVEPGFVITESGLARGGTDDIAAHGFAPAPADAVGRVVVWLASSPEAEAFLGTVVSAPRLAARLRAEEG